MIRYLAILAVLAQTPTPAPPRADWTTKVTPSDKHYTITECPPDDLVMIDKQGLPFCETACSPRRLAKAVRAHLDLEHPYALHSGWIGNTSTLELNPCSLAYLSPECKVWSAEQGLAKAKAELEAERKREKAMSDLRYELNLCEPKGASHD
jgi:hypothetical protein